ncbi:hypothetical protein DESC_40066 [Desulfosarcina cetonica]|nr:hypothetical protein DESC_40066 [Desulfosarcina cetonica]
MAVSGRRGAPVLQHGPLHGGGGDEHGPGLPDGQARAAPSGAGVSGQSYRRGVYHPHGHQEHTAPDQGQGGVAWPSRTISASGFFRTCGAPAAVTGSCSTG